MATRPQWKCFPYWDYVWWTILICICCSRNLGVERFQGITHSILFRQLVALASFGWTTSNFTLSYCSLSFSPRNNNSFQLLVALELLNLHLFFPCTSCLLLLKQFLLNFSQISQIACVIFFLQGNWLIKYLVVGVT